VNEIADLGERNRGRRRDQISGAFVVAWLVAIGSLWTVFAMAPTGALATADAGTLVAIRGPAVVTTTGYFQVTTAPSAMVGTPLQVVRTNSLWSETGLQLCASRSAVGDYWCTDLCDGFAGELSETPLARRAWSHGAMSALLAVAGFLTILGWIPAAIVGCSGD
jgi:hypothetical protein